MIVFPVWHKFHKLQDASDGQKMMNLIVSEGEKNTKYERKKFFHMYDFF